MPLSNKVKEVHYLVQQKVKPKFLTPEEIVNLQNQILIERGLCTDLRHDVLFFLDKTLVGKKTLGTSPSVTMTS